jgi:arginine decarboxylase
MVWHSTVAPGDIVVVDRNCHKSILHSIIMTGAIPVFLMPTRNHLGIIGPIPLEEFTLESIQKKIEANPFAREAKNKKPRILTITQSTYDGVLYNVETLREMLLDGKSTPCTSTKPGCRTRPSTISTDMHAIGKDRPRAKKSMIFTQSTHKLLAGLSQASQMLVRNRKPSSWTRRLQRGLPDAHLDLAAVLDHRLLRRGRGHDGSPGGTALVEESILEALDFRRAMRKVDEEWGKDWWFKVWGPDKLADEGIGERDDWVIKAEDTGTASATWHRASTCWTRSRPPSSPGPGAGRRVRRDRHPGLHRHQVPGRARRDRREVRPVLFIMFTIGITKGRWNTLVTLQQFKDDYDKNQPMWRILPEFAQRNPRYERMGLRDLCQQIHEPIGLRRGPPDHRDVPVGHGAGHEALGRLRQDGAPRDRARPIDELEGRVTSILLTPYAGHSAADPGRALQQDHRRLPEVRPRFQRALPGLRDRRPRPGQARSQRPPRLLRGLRQAISLSAENSRCLRRHRLFSFGIDIPTPVRTE